MTVQSVINIWKENIRYVINDNYVVVASLDFPDKFVIDSDRAIEVKHDGTDGWFDSPYDDYYFDTIEEVEMAICKHLLLS